MENFVIENGDLVFQLMISHITIKGGSNKINHVTAKKRELENWVAGEDWAHLTREPSFTVRAHIIYMAKSPYSLWVDLKHRQVVENLLRYKTAVSFGHGFITTDHFIVECPNDIYKRYKNVTLVCEGGMHVNEFRIQVKSIDLMKNGTKRFTIRRNAADDKLIQCPIKKSDNDHEEEKNEKEKNVEEKNEEKNEEVKNKEMKNGEEKTEEDKNEEELLEAFDILSIHDIEEINERM